MANKNDVKKNVTKVKSAKGEVVDFDLLRIKNQINETPRTVDVVARERFIDKRRRRTNRKVGEMLAQQEESKRYAEDAMRQQQEAKANAVPVVPEVISNITPERVSVEPKVTETENDSETKTNSKFNRTIKR